MKRFIYILLLIIQSLTLYAQQLPVFSQYTMNKYLYNPAVAGSDGYTSIFLSSRYQWVGIDKAPQTYNLSIQTRLLKRARSVVKKTDGDNTAVAPRYGRVGIGGYIYSDRYGSIETTSAQFTYAYHIFIKSTQLSFGLSGGIIQMKIDLTDLTFRSPEPLLNSDYRRALFIPDASFGVHILNKSYFVGISAAQLVQSAFKIGTEDLPNFSLVRNYYLMAGYRFYLSNGYELEPSFLLKTSELNMSQLDITLKIYSMGLWWAGLAYRTGSALSFQIGAKVQKLYFGYAYDYSLSNLQNYTFGTHELILALKFGDSSRRYRWLDRY